MGTPNKRVADDAFVEGEDQPATAAVERRKRPRRGNTLEDMVDDGDNELAC